MRRLIRILAITAALLSLGNAAGAAGGHQRLRLNETALAGGAEDAALRYFKQKIEQATHGSVTIDIHLGGGLGNPQTSVQDMMFGDLDLYSGQVADFLPLMIDEVSGLQTPFLVLGPEAARAYLASPLLDEARDKVLNSRHIRFLEMTAMRRPFHILATTRMISSPDDLAGLKITSQIPLTRDAARIWAALGGTYLAMPPSAFRAALAAKKIDGILYSDLGTARGATANLAPHLLEIEDCPFVWQISVNEAVWQKLTASEQSAFFEAASASAKIFETEAGRRFQGKVSLATAEGRMTYRTLDWAPVRAKLAASYRALVDDGALNPKVLETADKAAHEAR
jgi:TRAP-type C4-dicarboxylate transport system substrate-binding protein